jgi:hypothetical protein
MCVRKGKTVDTVNARNTLMGVGAKRERQKGKKKGEHRESNSVQKAAGGPLLGELLGDRTTLQS